MPPAIGKDFTSVTLVLDDNTGKKEPQVYVPNRADTPGGLNLDLLCNNQNGTYSGGKIAIYNGGRFSCLLTYAEVSYSYYKVPDAITQPKINSNDAGDFDESTLSGVYSSANPLNLSGEFLLTELASGRDIPVNSVAAKMYYQIDNLTPEAVTLTSLDANVTTTKGATFSASVSDILNGLALASGDHTLKVWFQSVTRGDELIEDNNEAGYVATFNFLDTASAIETSFVSKNVVSTGLYDLTGKPVPATANGFVIRRTVYSDGSVVNSKAIVK
jgi:hypothetical protein